MIDSKDIVIKCPSCGYEYLPGEIYLPRHFLGQPKEIERTIEGKIDVEFGLPQDLTERFVCDKCLKPFCVKANLSFEAWVDKPRDFDEEYTSALYSNRITLEEK